MRSAAVFGIIHVVTHGLNPEEWEPEGSFGTHKHRTKTVKINGERMPLLLRDIDLYNLHMASRQAQGE